MIENLFDAAKQNPFFNPFQVAKCSSSNNAELSLPKSTVIPSRNIAFAAAATGKELNMSTVLSRIFDRV